MPVLPRPRWPGIRSAGTAALTVALLLLLGACAEYPNSVFHNRTEFNRDVSKLFWLIIWLGTAVFIFVEVLLVWVMFRYRARPGQAEPKHVHGNTALEITWTAIPAVILAIIAVPTVQVIMKTQAPARADALQVEVIGHQWWWEFRYPQYGVVTANELYLPLGRTVNFTLKSQDVIHSFWIPSLGGKRDLMANRTNYLWFTPDSTTENAWNGVCVEYCGASHANMRFKTFTVSAENFESWAAHQKSPAAVIAAPAAATTAPAPGATATGAAAEASRLAQIRENAPNTKMGASTPGPTVVSAGPPGAGVPGGVQAMPASGVSQAGYSFPADRIPVYAKPDTPIPASLANITSPAGDAARGEALFTGAGTCFTCHTITGLPRASISAIGPNLTHIASRTTIGAGLYPNDTRHLTAWITNATAMKPGAKMPALGNGQFDHTMGRTGLLAKLDAQQVADLVAYLQTLK
jgi:cytochrome c oxidase subunit 2